MSREHCVWGALCLLGDILTGAPPKKSQVFESLEKNPVFRAGKKSVECLLAEGFCSPIPEGFCSPIPSPTLKWQVIAPLQLGRKEQKGTCDFEGGSTGGKNSFLGLFFESRKKNKSFFGGTKKTLRGDPV